MTRILATIFFGIAVNVCAAQNILMFVSHEETYYSEYIVMKQALEASGYSIDVRSASEMDFSIYMTPYRDITDAANSLSGSSYSEFQNQFSALFGESWDGDSYNDIPDFESVDGSILDVTDFSNYDGLIVVGGNGALDYRVDGDYNSQGDAGRLVSAADIQAAAEKLNALALEALLAGKPVMAQCHGASLPAFWRIPDTEGPGEEALGYSLLKGGISTGYPEDETPIMLESLDIIPQPNDRVTISSPHSSFEDNNAGEGRILTTRDWYPQTVAYAARSFMNVIETYPEDQRRTNEVSVLVLHGGALDESDMPSSCSGGNKSNDVPCNNGITDEDLPADFMHLKTLLEGEGAGDDFNVVPSDLDLSGSLPFDITNENQILADLERYDVVIFFKHWSTFITDELQSALVTYADNGGGVLALHHGLYNDMTNGQNKDILANELFGAHSTQQGWSATLTDYTVHSTNYGHFISSYLIDYEGANVDPERWNLNTLPISANTGFSTTHTFSIFDELYNNMAFTGTVDFGREVGDITPLFSNDQRANEISHTTGFTRLVDFNEDDRVGKVVYFEIGERKENFTVDSRFGQIVRNSVLWAAPESEEPVQAEQTIDYNPINTSYTYGDEGITLVAISSSTLDVSFSSSDEDILSVDGTIARIHGTGTVSITASQAGSGEFLAAEDVLVEYTIFPASLEITADSQTKTYGEENPTLTMSFDGFVYEEDVSVLTLPSISTEAILDSDVLSGGYDISLAGGGAANYTLALVGGTLTIETADQTIEIEEIEDKITTDPSFSIVASTTSGGALIFDVSGPATNEGNLLSLTGQSGVVDVAVSQAGTNNYNSASESISFNVSDPEMLDQEITFSPVHSAFTYGDEALNLPASSSSELDVTFSSSDQNVLSVSGTIATIRGAGTVSITATQAGNSEFNPAENVVVEFTIAQAELEIIADHQSKIYGDENPSLTMSFDGLEYDEDESVLTLPSISTEADASSDVVEDGYPIVLSGGTSDNYSLTLVNGILTIEKAEQAIEIESIPNKISTDPNFSVIASSTSGGALTYEVMGPATNTGNEISLTGESGTVEITVSQAGTTNYNSANGSVSFEVSDPAKVDQQISFTEISDKIYGDIFSLEASSTSELPVEYSVISGAIEINGNEVTIVGVGNAIIGANQVGDDAFNQAIEVQRSFFIHKADQILTVEAIEDKNTLDEPFSVIATVDTGLDLTYELNGEASIDGATITLNGEPGEVDVLVSQAGTEFYNYTSQVVSFDVINIVLSASIGEEIRLFPNPTSSALTIELPETAIVSLIDLQGKVLVRKTTKSDTFDLSAFNAGMYILQLEYGNKVVRRKIIKDN